jgi:hypothetical protein
MSKKSIHQSVYDEKIGNKYDGNPVVWGILHMQGKDYPIRCFTWLAFMMRINEIMREFEIEFPIGEDEEIRMVRQKSSKVERFR